MRPTPYYAKSHVGRAIPNSDRRADRLVNHPLHLGMDDLDLERVANTLLAALD